MEHGSFEDPSKATFSLTDEDHTLANAVRFTLNQDPRVTFCGYSIPHPSDARVNIRVQTTGDPAREVLNDSCQDLMLICQHVRGTFDQAMSKYKTEKESFYTIQMFHQTVSYNTCFSCAQSTAPLGGLQNNASVNISKLSIETLASQMK